MPQRPVTLQARLPDDYLGSTPTPFLHQPIIHARYNQAAQSSQAPAIEGPEASQFRGKAKDDFAAAHEGPREKVAEPTKVLILSPGKAVEQEVHTEVDKEAIARNKEKDEQMAAWRNVEVGVTRSFGAQSLAPQHLRPEATPEVLTRGKGRHQRERQDPERGR